MKIVYTDTCLPGCVGKDCLYRLPDTTRTKHHSWKNNPTLQPCLEPFSVIVTVPHCKRKQERSEFRRSVFDNANKAVLDAGKSCTTLRGKLRAEKKAFDRYASMWWNGPCPFYERGTQ